MIYIIQSENNVVSVIYSINGDDHTEATWLGAESMRVQIPYRRITFHYLSIICNSSSSVFISGRVCKWRSHPKCVQWVKGQKSTLVKKAFVDITAHVAFCGMWVVGHYPAYKGFWVLLESWSQHIIHILLGHHKTLNTN